MSINLEQIKVDIVEKEIAEVQLKVVDVIHQEGDGASSLDELSDVTISDLANYDVLARISGQWKNYKLKDLLSYFKVVEVPTRVNSKLYRTSNSYISGELLVYINGIKERYITEINSTDFEFEIDIDIDDIVEVEYLRQ